MGKKRASKERIEKKVKGIPGLTERIGPEGSTFKVQIMIKGKFYRGTFDTQRDAIGFINDVRAGRYKEEEKTGPGDMPFDVAVQHKLADEIKFEEKAAKTLFTEKGHWERLQLFFGKYTMREITPPVVAEFISSLKHKNGKPLAKNTIYQYITPLGALFHKFNSYDWQVRFNLAGPVIHPVKNLPKTVRPKQATPDELESEDDFATIPECDALLRACKKLTDHPKLFSFVLLLMHSGMRPKEAALLRLEDIKSKKGANSGSKFFCHLKPSRTKKRRKRDVPLSKPAMAAIKKIIPDIAPPDHRIFLPQGELCQTLLINPHLFFRRGFAAAKKAATKEVPSVASLKMYGLRHTAATYLIATGTDLRTVADILGHSKLDQVMRYAHALDDKKFAGVERLAALGTGEDLWQTEDPKALAEKVLKLEKIIEKLSINE